MDEHDLRRLVILAKARLENHGVAFETGGPSVRLRQQWVRCGKESCTKCPHGPYWYAFWREGGRRHSRYVGKLEDERDDDRVLDAEPARIADTGGRE